MSAFSGDMDQGPLVDPAQANLAAIPATASDNGRVAMVDGSVDAAENRVGASIRYIPLPSDYVVGVQNLRSYVQEYPHTVESHNIQAYIGTSNVEGVPQGALRASVPSEGLLANTIGPLAGPALVNVSMQTSGEQSEKPAPSCGIMNIILALTIQRYQTDLQKENFHIVCTSFIT